MMSIVPSVAASESLEYSRGGLPALSLREKPVRPELEAAAVMQGQFEAYRVLYPVLQTDFREIERSF
jgi:hypothetical protein